jgi:tetratricopeptide (TPR) repeat protein
MHLGQLPGHSFLANTGGLVTLVSADCRRAVTGLLLIDEDLAAGIDDPTKVLYQLVEALCLCEQIGDTARAQPYRQMAQGLLADHNGHPGVQAGLFRLHFHLGALARHKQECAVAYWHFMAGANQVAERGTDDHSDPNAWLFRFQVQIGATCGEMNRLPESLKALERAQTYICSEQDYRTWLICRAALLWHMGHFREAQTTLESCEETGPSEWEPETRVHWLLAQAVVNRDLGNVRESNTCLGGALRLAVEHRLDSILPRIQRLQRSPHLSARWGE